MKRVQIIGYYEEEGSAERERTVEEGTLISPDVAVTTCQGTTLYFVRVTPSAEEPGMYVERDVLTSVDLLGVCVDIASIPTAAALDFALWVAGKPTLAAAV